MIMANGDSSFLHPPPRILVSRCITFESCRYNGLMVASPLVSELKKHAECITPCPESDIGLGVPRNPVRLVGAGSTMRLLQSDTARDVTEEMNAYASEYVDTVGRIDGAILKARSPSCGLRDAKYYGSLEKGPAVGRTKGLFALHVAGSPSIPFAEDELRLQNMRIREHFLICIYTMARFRHCATEGSMKCLYKFHADHKLLLMAYNQTRMREMGRLLASANDFADTYRKYGELLVSALRIMPSAGAHINTLMHALGYFSKKLSSEEKAFFLDMLESFRKNHLPLKALMSVIHAWAVRYKEQYLLSQLYLFPYPDELSSEVEPDRKRTFL